MEEIHNRTLPQYVEAVEKLKRQKEDWVRMARAFREYKLAEIDREFEAEKKRTRDDFEKKKLELKEIIIGELKEKKKTIEAEKSTLELTSGVAASMTPLEVKPVVTRKLRRRPNEPPPAAEKKRKTNAERLNFLLTDEEIALDLKKISKHLKPPPAEDTSKATGTTGAGKSSSSIAKPEKCDPDAKIKDDKLYFNKEWYSCGDPIYLDSKNGERFNAQIYQIKEKREIWIKKLTEGTRLKIYVGHLQRGDYSIEKREVPPKKNSN